MANWGTFNWGEELWEGLPITATLKFYDRLGSLAKVVSTTAENSPLLKLSFEFLRDGGCGGFKLETSEDLGIERGYRFDLFLYQLLWYSARVKIVPATGTQTTFKYSGYGFFEQLDWKIVDETYADIELSALVESVLTNYYYDKSDILPGNGEIVPTDPSYSIQQLVFTKKFGKSTMQTLAEIASNYEYGVDENRHFYFRPYDTSIVERFWLGRGDIKSFVAEERDAKYNSYRVSCGRLTRGDNFILEVVDVPDGEFARWGTIDLPEAVPPFSATLAQGATVTTFPVTGTPANITDGNTGTEWSSGQYQQVGHYIQIDLGSEQENIGKVVVDSTRIANNDTDYADGFKILVSSTGAFAGEETQVFLMEEKSGSNEVEITFPAISGRYIRIEITDAKPFFWRVDQVYVYPWKVGDITRWAGSLLLLNRISLKKGKLELSKINRRILPRGKFRITGEDGSSYEDYPIISTKYQLNAKSELQCAFELGETTISVADEILKMQREMAEQKLVGSSRSSNLSSGLYTSPGSDQQIANQGVQAGMLNTVNADLSTITAGDRVITINANGITAVLAGTTMFYLSTLTGDAYFKGKVIAEGGLVIPVGSDKWAT